MTRLGRRAQWTSEWASARVLVDALGVLGTARVGWTVRRRVAAGEPWQGLGPPADAAEHSSRTQIGPAIVLYRTLTERLPAPEALALTGRAIDAGAVAFLRHTIGPLRRRDLAGLSAAAREQWTRTVGRRFFNATVRWDHIGDDSVAFTVTDCWFPRLCAAVGEPALAPLFCSGDAHFFGTVEPEVVLTRPTTRAQGGETCPFTLTWRDPD